MYIYMNNKYICTVCDERFTDTSEHILIVESLSNNIRIHKFCDELHSIRFRELSEGVEPKVGRCFCGGTISTVALGEAGWSKECETCGLIVDED